MTQKSSSNRLSRRDFIKTVTVSIGGIISAVIGLPVIGFLLSPSMREDEAESWILLGALDSYPIGIPTRFEFTRTKVNGWERTAKSYGVFILRNDDKNVRAFSNICTHLGCRVSWHSEIKNYVSPCHDGHFDILGNVVSGPPPRPLDEFKTRIEDNNLYILIPPFKRT
jgi:Rieske Fe-S protein